MPSPTLVGQVLLELEQYLSQVFRRMSMIHVLVADGVPLFRCGIRATLESTPECRVVGEATERVGIM